MVVVVVVVVVPWTLPDVGTGPTSETPFKNVIRLRTVLLDYSGFFWFFVIERNL